MVDRIEPALGRLRDAQFTMQSIDEIEGKSTIVGENAAWDTMAIIERGIDLLELEHSACVNACKSFGMEEDTNNALEIMHPDTWIRRLHQWGDEIRILMKNGLGEETTMDVGDDANWRITSGHDKQ